MIYATISAILVISIIIEMGKGIKGGAKHE